MYRNIRSRIALRMLERREQFTLPGKPGSLFPYVCDYWRVQGFGVSQPVEMQMHGEHFRPKLGLRRVCDAWLRASGDLVLVDVSFRAEITTEGAVVGAAAAAIFLPVAIVGGAISWAEFDSDATGMLAGFRQYTYAVALALHAARPAPAPIPVPSSFHDPFDPPVAAPAPGPAPEAGPARAGGGVLADLSPSSRSAAGACPQCRAPIHPTWKACPSCGERLSLPKLG